MPNEYVSNTQLGKLKIEAVINKSVFLAPKVYGYIMEPDSQVIIKIKGLTTKAIKENNITLESLEKLLIKDNHLEAKQESGNRNDSKTYQMEILLLRTKYIL